MSLPAAARHCVVLATACAAGAAVAAASLLVATAISRVDRAKAAPTAARPAAVAPMPWLSGVAAGTTADAAAWDAYRGRPVGVVQAYTDRTHGWDNVVDPGYLWNDLWGLRGTVVVSQPFWPENYDGAENLSRCAAGYYFTQWKRFGSSMVAGGRATAIVRLAWEANGTWFQWRASDPAAWKRCFQNTVAGIRATNPQARIEWSINAHFSHLPASHDAFDLYPGDGSVDVVGISAYDHYPPSRDQAEWDAQFNGPGGLAPLIRFATAHRKKFAVGEWGVADPAKGGGGDNSFYIQQMFNVFSFFRSSLAYETYLDDGQAGNVRSSLTTPGLNPYASRLYRSLWHGAR